jgi:hypothetical protein
MGDRSTMLVNASSTSAASAQRGLPWLHTPILYVFGARRRPSAGGTVGALQDEVVPFRRPLSTRMHHHKLITR